VAGRIVRERRLGDRCAERSTAQAASVALWVSTPIALPARLPAPARRALAEAGYARLEQLTHVTEAELGQLHGMGPKALRLLREALGVTGRGFEASEPRSCVRVLTDPRTASLE
jgi:hypothetical protein